MPSRQLASPPQPITSKTATSIPLDSSVSISPAWVASVWPGVSGAATPMVLPSSAPFSMRSRASQRKLSSRVGEREMSRSSPRRMYSSVWPWVEMNAVSCSSTMHRLAEPWKPLELSMITPSRSSMAWMHAALRSSSTANSTGTSTVCISIMRPRTPPHCSLTTAVNVSNISATSPTSTPKPIATRVSSCCRRCTSEMESASMPGSVATRFGAGSCLWQKASSCVNGWSARSNVAWKLVEDAVAGIVVGVRRRPLRLCVGFCGCGFVGGCGGVVGFCGCGFVGGCGGFVGGCGGVVGGCGGVVGLRGCGSRRGLRLPVRRSRRRRSP